MKTIAVGLFIGIFLSFGVFGQNDPTFKNDDTLLFFHRTGGKIDTFDLTYTFPLTSVPNGSINHFNSATTIDFFLSSPSLFTVKNPILNSNFAISALPHLGFFYSFGSKGSQFLHADYQQLFKNKSILNIAIDRNSSAFDTNSNIAVKGISRHGGFANQGFNANYKFFTRKISAQILGNYQQNSILQNGGIYFDSASLQTGLDFARVQKENAVSFQKSAIARAELKYNLFQDSIGKMVGIVTQHQYEVLNRIYKESNDTLYKLYNQINIDSTKTRDQFQDAKLKNGVGLFYQDKNVQLTTTIAHRYWRFQNLAKNIDTNEISFNGQIKITKGKWIINSTNYSNIIGAKSEFSSKNTIKWGENSKFLSASFSTESLLPSLVQRNYFANSTKYSTSLSKQNRTNIQLNGAYSFDKIDIHLSVGNLSWNNNLQWSNNQWEIGSQSKNQITYLKTKFHFDLNWFHFYPEFQLNRGSIYLPKAILSGRVLVKKKVFAAKKLEILFALDPQLTDKYKFLTYNPILDNWYFDDSNRSGSQVFSLHATASMAIEEFRFFVRAENIQSIWSPIDTEIQQNYYRAPLLIRLGISWDFFN